MKKRLLIIIIAAVLLIAVIPFLFFFLQKDKPNDHDHSHGTNDSSQRDDKIILDSSYTIIHASMANKDETDIFSALFALLRREIPGIKTTNDINAESSSTSSKEVIVGNTKRPESSFEIPEGYDFTIKAVDQKIVIKGRDAASLDAACMYFSDMIRTGGLIFQRNFSHSGRLNSAEKLILVGDQKTGELIIYDISNGFIGDPLWSVKTSNASIAGLKYRETEKHGKIILSCAADSKAQIFLYPSGKVIASYPAAQNPHSVEISPDGKIFAVASSNGNEIRFFNTDGNTNEYTAVKLTDAHGVLYDTTENVFWAVGGDTLVAYKTSINASGGITVDALPEKTYKLPADGAHDLQPVIGENGLLWISTVSKLYQFDKNSEEFITEFKNTTLSSLPNIKGISSFSDGSFCLVFPDKQLYNWTSQSFYASYKLPFAGTETVLKLTFKGDNHIYKIRAFNTEYAK